MTLTPTARLDALLRDRLARLAMVESLSARTSVGTCSITAMSIYIFEHVPMEVR